MQSLSTQTTLFRWIGFMFLLGSIGYAWMPEMIRASSTQEKVPVVASIIPLGGLAEEVGGDWVDVQILMPPGASPHTFEPVPSTVARAYRARVFIMIGAGLEPWSEKLQRSLRDRDTLIVEAARGVHLIEGEGPVESRTHEDALHGRGNPHIWLDPVLAQEICRRIADAFIRVDPNRRDAYESNLENYLGKLEALHQEIEKRVAGFTVKGFVSVHPAFAYFARRYGLIQLAAIEPAPGREPTPKHLSEIIRMVRESGIRAVFTEPQLNPRAAEVIAREAGLEVLTLDPVGGRPPYGSDYIELMRFNLSVFEKAMH